MRFTKMHGAGNDYVYVDCFAEQVADLSSVARAVSDRHFGIGGDGLVLILPSERADVRMRMFNADGSEAEMCGNAIRCVAKYAFEHGRAAANPMRVETLGGVKTIQLRLDGGKVGSATVDMGPPELEPARIPVDPAAIVATPEGLPVVDVKRWTDRWATELPSRWRDLAKRIARQPHAVAVSMGNPHVVLFCDAVADLPLELLGPDVENDAIFPQRINAHFVEVHSPDEVTMRTWERGSGITLACGTGASAVCVACVLTGRTARRVLAHLPGGDLDLEWREADGHVYMTGPAIEVFSGDWPGSSGQRGGLHV